MNHIDARVYRQKIENKFKKIAKFWKITGGMAIWFLLLIVREGLENIFSCEIFIFVVVLILYTNQDIKLGIKIKIVNWSGNWKEMVYDLWGNYPFRRAQKVGHNRKSL